MSAADKPAQTRERAPSVPGRDAAEAGAGPDAERQEDSALLSLTAEDRERLVMDSWEPSLLRKLLSAENRLKHRS